MRDYAKRISKSMTHDDEVSAVLLFGSVFTGNIHPESDFITGQIIYLGGV